jgi:hypothetical protein
MLTAHRLSFPTCLFHPRSIHLLCHLDSPSAANLPCLGLQQQTGPEVSELCGSYRVPSRSSLLPLRTLSPGESRSQAKPPVLPTSITSLTWRECCTTGQQATRSPALRGHNNPREKQTRAFQQVQQWQVTSYFSIRQHRIDSRSGSRGRVTNNPRRGQHRFELFRQRMYRLSQNNRYTPFGSEDARGFLCRGQTSSPQAVGGRMEEEPLSRLILAILFACTRVDTCHPWNCMHSISMHPLCTFSPCQELRIKKT